MEATVHFTYSKTPNKDSLCQGDVLEITPALREVLEEVHPYFTKEQYRYYMVLTQSCDLVRREGNRCKSAYITLAVVRSFDDFFRKTLVSNKYVEQINDLILLDDKNENKVFQLIERVYNNTEPDYFFLFKDNAVGLSESMVAYLKVSIALKAEDHYQECLDAKKIELEDEFKAKIGWLVGNIYSRVGTKDWDSLMDKNQKRNMLDEEIRYRCIRGNKEQIRALKNELNKREIKDEREALDFMNTIKVQSTYDKVISAIEDAFNTTGKGIPKEAKDRLLRDIKSRNVLKQLIR